MGAWPPSARSSAPTKAVRLEALQHYGGDPVRCAGGGRTEGPWKLDDLIQGTGNAHRATFIHGSNPI